MVDGNAQPTLSPRKAPTSTRRAATARGSELSLLGAPKETLGTGGTQVRRRCSWPPTTATASWSRCSSLGVPGPRPFHHPPLFSHTPGRAPLRRALRSRSTSWLISHNVVTAFSLCLNSVFTDVSQISVPLCLDSVFTVCPVSPHLFSTTLTPFPTIAARCVCVERVRFGWT